MSEHPAFTDTERTPTSMSAFAALASPRDIRSTITFRRHYMLVHATIRVLFTRHGPRSRHGAS
jgi:hypothetical protein